MKPQDLAREEIDRQLTECGWLVQSKDETNIYAGLGVAIREFQLISGFVDYLLYVDRLFIYWDLDCGGCRDCEGRIQYRTS